jgi:heme/copper-type cytochrome/quinol oxidase subunit 1
MLWSIGFMVTFIIGGLTGVLLAVPPADFLLHNSGVLIVLLVIGGSLWIMANLNHNMMPMDQIMQMQR